jgi:hypothetical protein
MEESKGVKIALLIGDESRCPVAVNLPVIIPRNELERRQVVFADGLPGDLPEKRPSRITSRLRTACYSRSIVHRHITVAAGYAH